MTTRGEYGQYPPAAYDAIGGLARRGNPAPRQLSGDGYLRHDDLQKPLTSKLRARYLKFRDGHLRRDDLQKPLTSRLRPRCLRCAVPEQAECASDRVEQVGENADDV